MSSVLGSLNEQLSSLVVDGRLQPARLLGRPFNVAVMDIDVTGRLYGQNGFRFAGTSANVDPGVLERAAQRVRHLEKLKPGAACGAAIRLGYDDHLDVMDAADCVHRLSDPRWRILCEVFWPHLSEDLFDVIRKERSLVSAGALDHLTRCSDNGHDRVLTRHALAIVYHNLALTEEIRYLIRQQDQWPETHWHKAMTYWAETLETDRFWDYLRDRAAEFDHPRFRPDDVNEAFRSQIAAVVLGFNGLFAPTYARMGNQSMYERHHKLITGSGMMQPAVDGCLVIMVRDLTQHQLDPLLRLARNPEGREYYEASGITTPSASVVAVQYACPRCGFCFAWNGTTCGHCGFSVAMGLRGAKTKTKKAKTFVAQGKVPWQSFASFYDPIMTEAEMVFRFLERQLGIRKDLILQAEFDALAEVVLGGLNNRIDYDKDTQPAILYSLITTRRLMALPLSRAMQRKLDQAYQRDLRSLYGDIDVPADLDVTQCWFLEGEPADPASSVSIPTHRILNETIVSVQYRTRHILVPRSKVAKERHDGRIKDAEIPQKRLGGGAKHAEVQQAVDAQRQLQEQVRRQRDQAVHKHQAACAAEIERFNATVAPQQQQDRALVEKQEARRKQRTAKLGADYEAAVNKLHARFASAIEQAERTYEVARGEIAGSRGLVRITLPVVGLSALVVAGVALAVSSALGVGPEGVFPAAIVGLLIGAGIDKVIRTRRLARARLPLRAVQGQRDQKIADLDARRDSALATIEADFRSAVADAQGRLESSEAQRRDIESRFEPAIRKSTEQADAEIARIDAEIQRLRRSLNNKIKPESHKTQYPVYRKAKSSGYHDGADPSPDRQNTQLQRFLNSLSDQEKMLLARLSQTMPEQQFGRLLEAVAEQPPGSRLLFLLHFMTGH